ncbi:MAG: hypothetical protein ABR557_02760 [Pyrinomonadaceae bacterium]
MSLRQQRVVEWMLSGEFDYGIAKAAIPRITSQYRDSGYAYTDYPYMPDYGISLTSPEWIRRSIQHVREGSLFRCAWLGLSPGRLWICEE